MTPSECAILNYFRRYDIGPSEMLFFNPNDCKLPMAPFQQCHGIAGTTRTGGTGAAQASIFADHPWLRVIAGTRAADGKKEQHSLAAVRSASIAEILPPHFNTAGAISH